MKRYLGFCLGLLAGCGALLCVQALLKPVEPGVGEGMRPSLQDRRLEQQLADAREKIAGLEADLGARVDGVKLDRDAEFVGDEPGAKEKALDFIELMKSFGAKEERDEIDYSVEQLAIALELSEEQIEQVRAAFEEVAGERQAAGIRVVTGQASVRDLMLADEDNPLPLDAALQKIVDKEQWEDYTAIQLHREELRVQKKTEEEVGELITSADLSEEQQRSAWEALERINAGERPQEIPEGTTLDDFIGYIDGAVNQRINALTPILTDDQLGVYGEGAEKFRNDITSLMRHATGGAKTP